MGMDIHRQLEKEFKFSDDTRQISRLQTVGRIVDAVSDRKDFQSSFFLIEKDDLNAFTIPGGRVYIFSGLMNNLKTDAQLASVLAHEIGHGAAKHVVKKYQAALGYNLIGSIAATQLGDGSGSMLLKGSNTVMGLIFTSYGRQDEYEADRLGIRYMLRAGYDPQGMLEAFEILKRESKGAYIPTILRSHPHLDDRIIQARREILKERGTVQK